MHEFTQLRECLARLVVRLGELVGEWARRCVQPCETESHRQGDEALLGAVVQVAFDATSLPLEGVHQSHTGAGEFDHLGVEAAVARGEEQPGQFGPCAGGAPRA